MEATNVRDNTAINRDITKIDLRKLQLLMVIYKVLGEWRHDIE